MGIPYDACHDSTSGSNRSNHTLSPTCSSKGVRQLVTSIQQDQPTDMVHTPIQAVQQYIPEILFMSLQISTMPSNSRISGKPTMESTPYTNASHPLRTSVTHPSSIPTLLRAVQGGIPEATGISFQSSTMHFFSPVLIPHHDNPLFCQPLHSNPADLASSMINTTILYTTPISQYCYNLNHITIQPSVDQNDNFTIGGADHPIQLFHTPLPTSGCTTPIFNENDVAELVVDQLTRLRQELNNQVLKQDTSQRQLTTQRILEQEQPLLRSLSDPWRNHREVRELRRQRATYKDRSLESQQLNVYSRQHEERLDSQMANLTRAYADVLQAAQANNVPLVTLTGKEEQDFGAGHA